MAISNFNLTDTFTTWRTLFNQVVTVVNTFTGGNTSVNGTLSLSNPGNWSNNVTLNVASGLIKGDGGLVANVQNSALVGTLTNGQLSNSTVRIISNSASLNVSSGNVPFGSNVFLNLSVSNSLNDFSNTNLTTANAVTQTYLLANTANIVANFAAQQANTAVFNAFVANTSAISAGVYANAAFGRANSAVTTGGSAFAQANAAYTLGNNAYNLVQTTLKLLTPPLVYGQLSADQLIVSGTPTKVAYDFIEFDNYSFWNNTTKRFQPNISGHYEITAYGQASSSGGTISVSYIQINKTGNPVRIGNVIGGVSSNSLTPGVTALVYLNGSTDYIEIFQYIDGTGTVYILGTISSHINIRLVNFG